MYISSCCFSIQKLLALTAGPSKKETRSLPPGDLCLKRASEASAKEEIFQLEERSRGFMTRSQAHKVSVTCCSGLKLSRLQLRWEPQGSLSSEPAAPHSSSSVPVPTLLLVFSSIAGLVSSYLLLPKIVGTPCLGSFCSFSHTD